MKLLQIKGISRENCTIDILISNKDLADRHSFDISNMISFDDDISSINIPKKKK